jgi:hypothetical protein
MTKKKTDSEFKAQVEQIAKGEYSFLDAYKDARTKITCCHNKCGNVWEISPDNFLRGKRCPECQNESRILNRRNSLKRVEEIIRQKSGGEFEYISGYVNSKSKVKLKHLRCGRTIVKPFSAFYDGISCSCEKTNRDIVDFKSNGDRIQCKADFQRYIDKYVTGEYVIIGRYVKSTKPILLKHVECGNLTEISPHNFKNGVRCDKCKSYKGELKIRDLLLKKGVFFEEQVRFSDCRLKKPLVFDFFLPIHNILIEFDGEQHIRPIERWGGEKAFQLQRKRDEIKNNYCKNNGITLVRIGYYENIEQKIKRYI